MLCNAQRPQEGLDCSRAPSPPHAQPHWFLALEVPGMQGSSSHPASGVNCSTLSPYLLSNKNKGEDLLLFNKCHSTSISLIYRGGMGGSGGGGCLLNKFSQPIALEQTTSRTQAVDVTAEAFIQMSSGFAME